MKKQNIVLIVISVLVILAFSPLTWVFSGIFMDLTVGTKAEIEIDSYRLCQTADGDDIIIVKYLLKNEGKTPTALINEGDFYVYQKGVSLSEYYEELPKECNYDTEDQYKNVKGGVAFYAEVAYMLEYPDEAVEIEVDDYGLFDKKKEKAFDLK